MATLKIEICTDNAAFGEPGSGEESHEIVRLLTQIIDRLTTYDNIEAASSRLMDSNGNVCGYAKL